MVLPTTERNIFSPPIVNDCSLDDLDSVERLPAQQEFDHWLDKYHAHPESTLQLALHQLQLKAANVQLQSCSLFAITAFLQIKNQDISAALKDPALIDRINNLNHLYRTPNAEEKRRRAVTRIENRLGCPLNDIFEKWTPATIIDLPNVTLTGIEKILHLFPTDIPGQQIRKVLDDGLNGPMQDRQSKPRTELRGIRPTKANLHTLYEKLAADLRSARQTSTPQHKLRTPSPQHTLLDKQVSPDPRPHRVNIRKRRSYEVSAAAVNGSHHNDLDLSSSRDLRQKRGKETPHLTPSQELLSSSPIEVGRGTAESHNGLSDFLTPVAENTNDSLDYYEATSARPLGPTSLDRSELIWNAKDEVLCLVNSYRSPLQKKASRGNVLRPESQSVENTDASDLNDVRVPPSNIDGALHSLRDGEWLSTTAIQEAMKVIAVNNTHFADGSWADLSKPDLWRQRRPITLTNDTIFILPLNHDGKHWTLAVADPSSRSIIHYDSLTRSTKLASKVEATLIELKVFLSRCYTAWSTDDSSVRQSVSPSQGDSTSECGIHVLATAVFQALRLTLPQHYDARLWRLFWRASLENPAELRLDDGNASGSGPEMRRPLARMQYSTAAFSNVGPIQATRLLTSNCSDLCELLMTARIDNQKALNEAQGSLTLANQTMETIELLRQRVQDEHDRLPPANMAKPYHDLLCHFHTIQDGLPDIERAISDGVRTKEIEDRGLERRRKELVQAVRRVETGLSRCKSELQARSDLYDRLKEDERTVERACETFVQEQEAICARIKELRGSLHG